MNCTCRMLRGRYAWRVVTLQGEVLLEQRNAGRESEVRVSPEGLAEGEVYLLDVRRGFAKSAAFCRGAVGEGAALRRKEFRGCQREESAGTK